MPASYTITYHRNHTSSDTTTQSYTQSSATFTLKTIDELGWDAPTGYTFQAWNTAADGSGVTRYPGNTTNSYTWYAIWEQLPAVTYTTTSTELTTVADAIRAKGGTSSALEWPSGFAQAIADIPSGGGGGTTEIAVSQSSFTIASIRWVDGDDVLRSDYETVVGDTDAFAVVNPMVGSRLVISMSFRNVSAVDGLVLEDVVIGGSRPAAYFHFYKVTG